MRHAENARDEEERRDCERGYAAMRGRVREKTGEEERERQDDYDDYDAT